MANNFDASASDQIGSLNAIFDSSELCPYFEISKMIIFTTDNFDNYQ